MSKVRDQPQPARRGAAIVLLAVLAPQGTLLLLRTEPRLDVVLQSATVHLVVVSAISACALAVAVAAAVAAGRSRDGSLVLLALGCLAVGFLMLGHGLMTPGIGGRPLNLWVGRLPVLAIVGFAAGLCAAAWPQQWPAVWAGRWPRGTLAAGAAVLGLVPGAAVVWPAAAGGLRPLPGEASSRTGGDPAPVRLTLSSRPVAGITRYRLRAAIGAKREYWPWKVTVTVSVGPLRCLARIRSASPLRTDSGS
jgi:hypothetical protein